MTWHTFFGAFNNYHLWYLPTAYFTVATVQLGYLAWVGMQWLRVPRKPEYPLGRDGLR